MNSFCPKCHMLIIDGHVHTPDECMVSEIMEEYDEPKSNLNGDIIQKAVWEIQNMEDEYIMKILNESKV